MNIIETNLDFSPLKERTSTNRIILHNSGVTVLQSVEIIHNYHKNTKGWAGIGYHFYVRKDGSIYRGRPENTVGAHAYNNNNDSIGICFEGDFNQEILSEVQKNAGKELISYLCEKYGIDKIQGHREVNNTSCPGSNFPLDEMKEIKKSEEPQTTKSSSRYLVKVTTDALNIRSGAGTNHSIVGCIRDKGTYTIVETSENWGKLKSGAGWICLDYTQKVGTTNNDKPAAPVTNYSKGQKVTLKTSASKYCTGQTIPNSVKGKTYTIMQVGSGNTHPNGVLLKEIYSWVYKSDVQ